MARRARHLQALVCERRVTALNLAAHSWVAPAGPPRSWRAGAGRARVGWGPLPVVVGLPTPPAEPIRPARRQGGPPRALDEPNRLPAAELPWKVTPHPGGHAHQTTVVVGKGRLGTASYRPRMSCRTAARSASLPLAPSSGVSRHATRGPCPARFMR